MADAFTDHRVAARALINSAPLKSREGQFLGGIAFDDARLTDKQRRWLDILLDRHGLPPLNGGSK